MWQDGWSDVDEAGYRTWLKSWSEATGVPYDPDDPTYDYRVIYQLNLAPRFQPEHGQYRWSDIGKSKEYREKKSPAFTPLQELPSPLYQWIEKSKLFNLLGYQAPELKSPSVLKMAGKPLSRIYSDTKA